MEIEISNKEDLITQRIQIKILKLKPNSKLKITLKTELPWCLGEEYSSYGVFLSNEKGEVDLALAKPIYGTYENAGSMGLIYSLRKSKTQGKNIAENISIEKPILINMTFEAPYEKKEINLKRLFKTEDVIVKNINEKDFAGKLFFRGKANKTVLMLGGSSGDSEALSLLAGPLASYGFNILVVPYFEAKGLPDKLEKVPLEYFEGIFKWLQNNEILNSKEIFLHGTSKGGELALLLASRYKEIKKVVAVEPHAYCFQALDGMMSGNNVSSWSYKDQSIPYIEVDNNIFFEEQKKAVKKGISFGFASTYKKSIEKALSKEDARIKIENSNADILMITGKEDNIWNSYEGCKEIVKNLKKNNYKHKVELLAFDKMGHPIPVPYIIPISETLSMNMMGGVFSSGGTIEGNAEGQYKSWRRTIEFLK